MFYLCNHIVDFNHGFTCFYHVFCFCFQRKFITVYLYLYRLKKTVKITDLQFLNIFFPLPPGIIISIELDFSSFLFTEVETRASSKEGKFFNLNSAIL